MGSYRTVFLLTLAAACGIGSGVLGLFYDGLATVALFMAFPFVVAVLFLSIVHDVVNERVGETESSDLVAPLRQAGSAELVPGSEQPKAA